MAFDLNELTNTIRNPFSKEVTSQFMGQDFPEGFLIEELSGAKEKVRLVGNMMPHIPFTFGGQQRIKKDFYAGSTEPVTQVLGTEEDDVTIKGLLKDKRYPNDAYYGVSTEIQQLIDAVRIRGNLCRFVLGEWERYGYVQQTVFNMNKLSNVEYSITFSISGFNAPKNAVFLQKQKIIPFEINKDLIDAATQLQELSSQVPTSVPQSISDVINGFVSEISSLIATVTDLVDSVIKTVGDIQKSISRILGLVKNIQNKIREYKGFLSSLNPFGSNFSLTDSYSSAKFYASSIAGGSALASLMNRYRNQFKAIANNTPLGRHIVKDGDNLQKISVKFYETPDNWKEILDYNNLSSTSLEIGKILEIPRV